MSRPKTITVSLSIRLSDPEQWTETFGTSMDDLVDDVRNYAFNLVDQCEVFANEVNAEVKLRNKPTSA